MRSVGGACVGLAACVFGCASAWKPPPEPPPPTPFVEAPSKWDRGLDWNAKARRIGCGPADFTVPAELANRVQMNGPNELTIVPPGSPPGGALMARIHDPPDEVKSSESDNGFLGWIFKALAEKVTLGNELMAMARLHLLASGLKPEALPTRPDGGNQDTVKVTTDDEVLEMTYEIGEETWRLVGIEGNRCVIMAIERVSPNATHHFDDVAKQMRAVARGFKLRY
jgi:hypothetical protein